MSQIIERTRKDSPSSRSPAKPRTPRDLTLGGDMTVHRLGYGALHLTGHGMWGDPSDMDGAVRVLRKAVSLGINFIDTADAYGPGHNERVIRRALHPYPDDLVISTKGGLLRSGPKDWTLEGPPYIVPLGRPAYLRQQVELSLQNLGVDCIKLYQLHSIDPTVPLAPDTYSTISGWPSEARMRSPRLRMIASVGPPAGNGTTTVIGLFG